MCMNRRTISFIVLALVLSAGQESLVAQEPIVPSSSDMVMVDGLTVPDIGPMPAFVPMPAGNVNYVQKIELGKQLYFDGRLSKNNAVSCAFCHNPGTGF